MVMGSFIQFSGSEIAKRVSGLCRFHFMENIHLNIPTFHEEYERTTHIHAHTHTRKMLIEKKNCQQKHKLCVNLICRLYCVDGF